MELVPSCDTDIISMLKNRDQRAVAVILEKYGDQLYGFIFQQLNSEQLASDALKKTLSLVWETPTVHYHNPKHFFIYLLRQATKVSAETQRSLTKST